MDHNIDPDHVPHGNDLAHWASLEGKSEAAASDLEQKYRHDSPSASERMQTVLGIIVVVSVCCVSAWLAIRKASPQTADTGVEDTTLAIEDHRNGP